MEPTSNPQVVEPPLGLYAARVDEKGRLKLPVDFQRYLTELREGRVFVTTLDLRIARIYPISLWKESLNLMKTAASQGGAAKDIGFIANEFGGVSEVDGQGRLLVPAELRKLLSLENQPVWLESPSDRINMYNKDAFETRQRESRLNLADKLETLEKLGLR